MDNPKTIDRREFTLATAMLALSGVAITITACGGGSPSAPDTPGSPQPSPNGGDKVGVIGTNHGHSAVITSAEIIGGAAISLDIRGQSDHPHTVVLSAAEVVSIGGNKRVSKESTTNDGHSHTVTFN
jgi:hypothetical protein